MLVRLTTAQTMRNSLMSLLSSYSRLGGRLVQALFFLMDGLLIAGAIVLNEYLKGKTNTGKGLYLSEYTLGYWHGVTFSNIIIPDCYLLDIFYLHRQ